ncbi:MAG: hypothetical protein KGR48_11085 [Alphaproteobacteria bacterium]|nr:hypothetical protein [Alphaproteobacteria bacterium]MBU6471593.1 hypothetical protein [Alphaproteobacteria bacterium]MDE2073799.1 hypothetical protein [Alphaproteobacteria bacterium]MDE2352887.1 hypothetical protein [Alphaproteobacteria bacterium]
MRPDRVAGCKPGATLGLLGKALAVCAIWVALLPATARAGVWFPAAGSGDIEAMLRYDYADQQFPANSFSSATQPGSSEHKTQIRLLGEHGFGNGFSLNYDLRYAFLYRSKVRHGVRTVSTNDGLQDQEIGLNYTLTQQSGFADAIGLGLVIPGSAATGSPGLDSGQWAAEPVYRLGFKPGFWKVTTDFDIGTRLFMDGGVAQFRSHLEIRVPVMRGLHLAGKLFLVRSARLGAYNDLRDRGELYNLFRVGVEAAYHLTDQIEPVLAYENDVAGAGRHASQRFTIGVKINY